MARFVLGVRCAEGEDETGSGLLGVIAVAEVVAVAVTPRFLDGGDLGLAAVPWAQIVA